MSTDVENKVLQLTFNNVDFEKGVSVSIKSLEKLDENLNNLGQGFGSSEIKKAFGSISDNISETESRFNAFETVISGVFFRLGQHIADLGLDLVNSFTIDVAKTGWDKYESQVKATAGLYNIGLYNGKTYEQVLGYLDELQWYADATSFSMDAMTKAFLAAANAGTDMDEAVDVIMGLGNAFMYSGATATEMDGAFAMFSKVMSDSANLGQATYRSLEQVYKVITPEMQDRFINTAKDMLKISEAEGQLIKEDFKASLANKWLTGDVVKNVFGNQYGEYADAVYKFAAAWRKGTLEISSETKALADEMKVTQGQILTTSQYMDLYDKQVESTGGTVDEFGRRTFEASMEAKTFSEVVDALKDASSSQFTQMYKHIFGNYMEAKELFTSLGDYLSSYLVVPIASLSNLIGEWMSFKETVIEDGHEINKTGRDYLIQSFVNIARAIESIINPIKEAFSIIFKPMNSEQLFNLTKRFNEFTKSLIISESSGERIKTIFQFIFTIAGGVASVFSHAIELGSKFFGVITPIGTIISDVFITIMKGINTIGELGKKIGFLDNVTTQVGYSFNGLKKKITPVQEAFDAGKTVFEVVIDLFKITGEEVEGLDKAFENFNGTVTETFDTIRNKVSGAFSKVQTSVGGTVLGAVTNITNAFAKLNEIIENFQQTRIYQIFKTIFETVRKYTKLVIEEVTNFIKMLFSTTEEVGDNEMELLQKYRDQVTGKNSPIAAIFNFVKEILGIIRGFYSISILKNLKDSTKVVETVSKGFTSIGNAIETVQKAYNAKFLAALGEISQAFREIRNELHQVTKNVKAMRGQIRANTIKSITASLLMIAASIAIIAFIPEERLKTALVIVGSILAVVVALFLLLENVSKSEKAAEGLKNLGRIMLALGATMILIAAAISKIAKIEDQGAATRAFAFIMAILFSMMVMFRLLAEWSVLKKTKGLTQYKNISDYGYFFLKLASGLLIIAQALKMLAEIPSVGRLWSALGVVVVLLAVMTGLLVALAHTKVGTFRGESVSKASMAFVAMAVAMIFMAGAIALVANIDFKFESLKNIILAFIGIIVAFGVASRFVRGGQMLALSASISLFSLGILTLVGTMMILSNLDIASILKGAGVVAAILGALTLISRFMGLSGGVQMLALAVAIGVMSVTLTMFVKCLQVISTIQIGSIVNIFKNILVAFGAVFAAAVIAALIMPLMNEFAKVIFKFALSLFLVAGAIGLAVLAFKIMADMIKNTTLGQDLLDVIGILCAVIAEAAPMVIKTLAIVAAEILEWIGGALASAALDILEYIFKALTMIFEEVALKIYFWISEKLGHEMTDEAKQAARDMLDGMMQGFRDKFHELMESLRNLGRTMMDSIKKVLGIHSPSTEFAKIGGYTVQGLVDGLNDKKESAFSTIKSIGQGLLDKIKSKLDINSPSGKFEDIGNYIVEGLKKGIEEKKSAVTGTMEKLGDLVQGKFTDALNLDSLVPDNLEMDLNITPVIDSDALNSQMAGINDLVDSTSVGSDIAAYGVETNINSSILAELANLREQVSTMQYENITLEDIMGCLSESLSGVGVFMDKSKVGNLITNYQESTRKAGGI